MDIEFIRKLVKDGKYKTTLEFDRRMNQREFSLEQVKDIVYSGKIVRTERKKRTKYPRCTIRGHTHRSLAGLPLPGIWEMEVSCAVGEEVIFITAYWLK